MVDRWHRFAASRARVLVFAYALCVASIILWLALDPPLETRDSWAAYGRWTLLTLVTPALGWLFWLGLFSVSGRLMPRANEPRRGTQRPWVLATWFTLLGNFALPIAWLILES
jgi:hypothetical protein